MESYGLVHFLPKGGRPGDVGVSASVQEISKLPDAARDRRLVESLGVSLPRGGSGEGLLSLWKNRPPVSPACLKRRQKGGPVGVRG